MINLHGGVGYLPFVTLAFSASSNFGLKKNSSPMVRKIIIIFSKATIIEITFSLSSYFLESIFYFRFPFLFPFLFLLESKS